MHIVIDSGSTRVPTGTLRPPALNQVKYLSPPPAVAGRPMSPASTMQAMTNAPPTATVPIQPATGSPMRRPTVTSTRKPARGNSNMRYARWTTGQPLSESRSSATVVARRRKLVTTMPSPTTTSAAATTSTKKTMACPPMSLQHAGEGDEGEVGCVEHQLDAHEHDQHVAPHQQADGPDGEDDGGEAEVPGSREAHADSSLCDAVLGIGVQRGRAPGQHHGADDGDDQQRGGGLEREAGTW